MSQTFLTCSHCGKAAPDRKNALQVCACCGNAQYCDRGCQKLHWKHGDHKRHCKRPSAGIRFSDGGEAGPASAAPASAASPLIPVHTLAGMPDAARARALVDMRKDSRGIRRPAQQGVCECWNAMVMNHGLVLGYMSDLQWSMASTYVGKWELCFDGFRATFAGGFDIVRDGVDAVQQQVAHMGKYATTVNFMVRHVRNSSRSTTLLDMPGSRARCAQVYDLVGEIEREYRDFEHDSTTTFGNKLKFMVEFRFRCVHLLQSLGFARAEGVDVPANLQRILAHCAGALGILRAGAPTPQSPPPYPCYPDDLEFFTTMQAAVPAIRATVL